MISDSSGKRLQKCQNSTFAPFESEIEHRRFEMAKGSRVRDSADCNETVTDPVTRVRVPCVRTRLEVRQKKIFRAEELFAAAEPLGELHKSGGGDTATRVQTAFSLGPPAQE